MLIKLEGLELGEDGLRVALLVLADQGGPRPGLRKARTVEVSGETLADQRIGWQRFDDVSLLLFNCACQSTLAIEVPNPRIREAR